jgi:uncharacterized damage-inducible protein DinB
MTDFTDQDLGGSTFRRVNLSGAAFHEAHMTDMDVRGVDLSRTRVRSAYLDGVRLTGVEAPDLEIYGELGRVLVNGVDVVPLVEAELDRRTPERALMRPADVAGFHTAFETLDRLWSGTLDRARALPREALHERVDGEWSFIETLHHLVFATDAWVRRAILGDPSPWDSLDLPWDEMPDTPGIPRDRDARPSLEEVLALRRDRMATVRTVIDGLTDESLAAHTAPVEGADWPPPESFPVRECLLIVLNEEWHHRLFAERDLDALVRARE